VEKLFDNSKSFLVLGSNERAKALEEVPFRCFDGHRLTIGRPSTIYQTVSEEEFSEVRKSLAAVRVLVVFAAAAQGCLCHGVDEPRDEAQSGEDVDRREELAERQERYVRRVLGRNVPEPAGGGG
jgi:hypothetical protein